MVKTHSTQVRTLGMASLQSEGDGRGGLPGAGLLDGESSSESSVDEEGEGRAGERTSTAVSSVALAAPGTTGGIEMAAV